MLRQTHLDRLEAESIHILREVAASCANPCMFYSIGKDSTVMLHLARKAFAPAPVPFPLLHIDTTWEFAEMARFRDKLVQQHQLKLEVYTNHAALQQGVHPIRSGSVVYNDQMKTVALKQALQHYGYDAALGGARRDEERSRAKERVFSVRNEHQQWEPKTQRPELWQMFNTDLRAGQTMRVFPLSNWTEFDIWSYIARERIDLVPLYFAAERLSWVDEKTGQVLVLDDDRMREFLTPAEQLSLASRMVRFRTLGCYPQTGAVHSHATRVEQIIEELLASKTSEREGRLLDKDQSASMERKKREGYF